MTTKHYEAVVIITPHLLPLSFLILQSLFLNATPKYFKFPILQKFQTMYQICNFLWCKIPTVPLEYSKSRNVAHQNTDSL